MKFSIILTGFAGMLVSVLPIVWIKKRIEELCENKTISNPVPAYLIYVVLGIVIFVLAGRIGNDYLRALVKGLGIGIAGGIFTTMDR